MTRVMERPYSANRFAGKKPAALKSKLQTAEARIEVLDDIDALKEMNAQLSESLAKTVSNESQTDEKLWADVDGDKEDHHLGAGLNGRWF
ncbi:hypothetical protein PsAD46_05180 [Pseudovibrio sp. Ad46]|uniref:hypothetical protein n=2 Tax=unclassified Pseudovibrio TaxID=2627060 RepID=UPI0007B2DB6F|nr:hypothetical protein [Pseudovibrio sp. Ad5]KZK76764.1 hypothetical protein PsAD46_05180 [Pseudovibrio sp. Ad46]KZK99565.1 hypothetical protein PsAD5_01403 [Pseudovibrio sp. Ad5]